MYTSKTTKNNINKKKISFFSIKSISMSWKTNYLLWCKKTKKKFQLQFIQPDPRSHGKPPQQKPVPWRVVVGGGGVGWRRGVGAGDRDGHRGFDKVPLPLLRLLWFQTDEQENFKEGVARFFFFLEVRKYFTVFIDTFYFDCFGENV